MTFWDWADKHSGSAETVIVLGLLFFTVAAVRMTAWISMGLANIADARRKAAVLEAKRVGTK